MKRMTKARREQLLTYGALLNIQGYGLFFALDCPVVRSLRERDLIADGWSEAQAYRTYR